MKIAIKKQEEKNENNKNCYYQEIKQIDWKIENESEEFVVVFREK